MSPDNFKVTDKSKLRFFVIQFRSNQKYQTGRQDDAETTNQVEQFDPDPDEGFCSFNFYFKNFYMFWYSPLNLVKNIST